jgi:hypothetical protein
MRILQNNGFKSVGSKALGFCFLFLAGLTFLACPPEPSADTVESVTVSPANPSVVKGKTQEFTATVHGTGNLVQTVTWDVEGKQSSGTKITADGILTVAADETASSLTVRATSTQDTTKSGKATVTVAAPPPPAGAGERVTVTMTNPSPSVVKGSSYNFSAEVITGTGDPDLTVTWSVDGGEGTSIDEHGVLTVAADETAATLTIRAASTQDAAKFGELTVMVADDDEEGEKTDFIVGAADFPIVMKSISDKPGTYTVTLTEDVINYGGVTIIDGVTITVNGGNNEIVWKHDPLVDADLFAIRGGHLVVSNIKLRHAENIESWALISNIGSGTVEVKDGVILTGDEEAPDSDGVYLEGGTFTMSGGEISGLRYGIILNGNGTTATISGGTIKDNGNNDSGDGVIVLGNGNTLTISGGNFEGNIDGVNINGTGNTLTVTGGNFEKNTEKGVGIQGTGNTIAISDGNFEGNIDGVDIYGTGNTITISGGTFKDNSSVGVRINGTGNTGTVTDGIFSDNFWVGIGFDNASSNCVLTISGGTITGNGHVNDEGNGEGEGVDIEGTGNSLTISGGEIKNNKNGVTFWEATDCTLTIEDGASISNNANVGIGLWDQNWNNTIIMSGGEIKDNNEGINIQGTGNSVTISGGEIKNNNNNGVNFWEATDCTLTIEDGVSISNNANQGIGVWVQSWNNTIIMLGGEIKNNNNDWCAVAIQGENCNFIMKGGSIGGNAGRGIVIEGPSSGFEKTGGIIYGNDAGDNSNAGGAISLLYKVELNRTTEETEQLKGKINATGDGIALQEGNWD